MTIRKTTSENIMVAGIISISFSHNIFNSVQEKSHDLRHTIFVIYKYIQYGGITNFVIW